MSKQIDSKIIRVDSRKLNEVVTDMIVDVTITSPPYFDLKDYGYPEQIGFGQKYDEYLGDLQQVFKNVYECTKDSGTLWVIIDSFRKDGEVIPLPFDFSNKIKEVGWKLQDIIIWQKDRTVPWAHKGQMRNLFEYILVFSKSTKYNFFIDKIRDFELLKKWWVKYPERYNPLGKTPDGIWHYEIPLQGSWGNGYIKHFCPLPENLIEQILKLTTNEGDVVLDPFAGSGAVLSKADSMARKYIGLELNDEYISMFEEYLQQTQQAKRDEYIKKTKNSLEQKKFKKLNLDLRALKYGRVLISSLPVELRLAVRRVYVEIQKIKTVAKNKWITVKYYILITEDDDASMISEEIKTAIGKPPLSKYGVNADNILITEEGDFREIIENAKGKIYTYTNKITHKFFRELKNDVFDNLHQSEIILSKVKVDLNENDYE